MEKIQQFRRSLTNLKFAVILLGMSSDPNNTRDKYSVEHQYFFAKYLFG